MNDPLVDIVRWLWVIAVVLFIIVVGLTIAILVMGVSK